MKENGVLLRGGFPRLLLVFLVACLLGEMSGCGGGSSTPSESTVAAPTNLAYPQSSVTAIAGEAIAADTPSVTGTVTSYSVSPALPAGLSLNASTGTISGAAVSATVQASFTITAANASGSTSAVVQIVVNPAPPTGLAYAQSTIAGVVGRPVAGDTPSVTGTVSSFTVSPTLPAGLSLNGTTGTISGTPTAVSAAANYTVTATNVSGSTTAVVQIAVNVAAPANLVYPVGTVTGIVGQAISADVPTVTGTVSGYSVSPALPAGLSLNATTGAISGTPTAVTAQASYTVTATNVTGSTSAVVQVAVNQAAPTNLVYPQMTIVSVVQMQITTDTPTVTGAVTSYSISPGLPAGLSFSSSTGAISGTTTAVTPLANYTVTASNASGSTTAVVQITVNSGIPTSLVYPQSMITAAVDQPIEAETPRLTTTYGVFYSIQPALPAGFSFGMIDGTISGIPQGVSPQANYTITAANQYGSTTAVVTIVVNPAAPTSISYPQTTINAVAGQPIAADTPTVVGTVTSYSVSPALPAGLTLNATTGVISGTPTVVSPHGSYTVTAANVTGSILAVVQITVNSAAPMNLLYPQGTITGLTGQAIATDTPTVTGTVTSYTVSPALPSGLSLNSTTGAISGTPTGVSPQATYTVTATNASGSTTAAVQIAVNMGAPTNLVYSQTAIAAYVNGAITTDTPSVTGTVAGYTVSPALPAGLSLDPASGTISGTPTAASAQTVYTVTATNTAGSTTANVTIAVTNFTSFSLVDLGHAQQIAVLRAQATRLFSQDYSGHWVLWDYGTATQLASGESPWTIPGFPYPSDMAGSVIAVGIANAVEIRSTTDGSLITTLTWPSLDVGTYCPPTAASANECTVSNWWELATDGSYVVSGYGSGLYVWSTVDGHLMFSRSGNYSKAKAFAAPGQVQIGLGPAGTNVIETDSVPSGSSSIGPAFTATFWSWFSDGSHFFTNNAPNTLYVYSANSVQQGSVALNVQYYTPLGGYGNWFWFNDAYDSVLDLYGVGGSTPAYTYTVEPAPQIIAAGSTIGVVEGIYPYAGVLDLSGPTPSFTQVSLPVADNTTFAAFSPTQWVVGSERGVLLDGPSVATTARFFGYGNVLSMAGAQGEVSVATASGRILTFNPGSGTLLNTIDFTSSKVMLSDDGTVLAAKASDLDGVGEPDRTLNLYSMPSGAVAYSFPYQYIFNASGAATPGLTMLLDFTLSGSGTVVGQLTETSGPVTSPGNQTATYTRQVTPASGSPVIWSDSPAFSLGPAFLSLSPDGSLIAASSGPCPSTCSIPDFPNFTTAIDRNGIPVATVSGVVAGWIDNNRVLVDTFTEPYVAGTFPTYAGAVIYDGTGTQLATLATLPQLTYGNGGPYLGFQTVNPDAIYVPAKYSIYSLTTGAAIWTEAFPPGAVAYYKGTSALAGDFVVYTYNNRVYVDLP